MMMNEEGSEGGFFFFSFWVFLGMKNEREGVSGLGGFSRGGRGGGGILSKVALATLMAAQPSLSLSPSLPSIHS